MINRRGLYVLLYVGAIWLGLCLGLRHPHSEEAITCQTVLDTVDAVGAKAAEKAARAAGATDAQIAAAKKCLSDFKNRNRSTK